MENALYVSLSRQMVLQTQMDMVANNVANINTPGYREQSLLFKEYVEKPTGQVRPYSMVADYGQFTNNAPGTTQVTGAPLDVALQGPGFFTISTPNGLRYSRGGDFSMNAAGELITPSGDKVASAGGSPITIPAGTREIKIDERGTVSTENGIVGQLGIVEFGNTDQLVREGSGLYVAPGNAQPTPATNTRTMQGMLEGSNVQGVTEMTRMISILRDYQSLQKLIQNEHDLERTAIQRLTGQG